MQRVDQVKKRLLNGINEHENQKSAIGGNRTSLPGVRNKFTFDITNNNFYYREDGQESLLAKSRKNQNKFINSIVPEIEVSNHFNF